MRALLADRERRERMGRAARRWVAHHLGLEQSLDAYADLYRRVAGRA